MPVAGGAFGQCHNAQAVVDAETMLVLVPQITQAANDKPDTLAGTAVRLSFPLALEYWSYAFAFRDQVQALVLAALGALPANSQQLIHTTINKLFLRIKDIVRQGGRVQLDDVGTFSARWTKPRTLRDSYTGAETLLPAERLPAFVPTLGYKLGTREGRLLSDSEARTP